MTKKAEKLSDEETRFVAEFLIDFDPVAAAMRIGFPRLQAKRKAKTLMDTAAVAKQIQTSVDALSVEQIATPQRILAGLMATASHPRTFGVTRVAAFKAIHDVLKDVKVQAKKDAEEKLKSRRGSGVMIVPGMAALSDWEKAAMDVQAQLKEQVKE